VSASVNDAAHGSGRVLVLLLPGVNLLDLGGPVQVFDAASYRGGAYRIEYVAARPEVTSGQGLRLAGLGPLGEVEAGDLVLIPGPQLRPPEPGEPIVDDAVVRWLRLAYDNGARFASVCTGAAALGESGLLNGRRCTTHWSLIEAMRGRYPAAHVQDAVLYVHDGPVSTSAGFSTGIDLALSLVERDHGPALAAAVARQLVLYLRRSGAREQISPFLRHRAHLHSAVHRVQDHLAQHLDVPHTLEELASVARLSPRGLTRAFTATIGMTPHRYQEDLRLELAASLLAETELPIEAVATRCGFRDARHFRRLFTARHGLPPSKARRPSGENRLELPASANGSTP
jgi:transcriptional regulator GlxA family with amidase domain